MSDDPIDDALAIIGAFDWITPVYNWLQGYNDGTPVGSFAEAVMLKDELKSKGIKAKVEGDVFSGYRVMQKK